MGFGKLGIFLENGAFPRGRIWDEGWESWRKKTMKLLSDVESKMLWTHPSRNGQKTAGEMVLEVRTFWLETHIWRL